MSPTRSSDDANPNLLGDPIHGEAEAEVEESDPGCDSVDEESEDEAEMDIIPASSKPDTEDPSRKPKEEYIENSGSKLCYRSSMISIESAILKIEGQSSHEVYGKIVVSGPYARVYAIYDCKQERPDSIKGGQSCELRLCGPKHSLDSCDTEFIHVRLYEKGHGHAEVLVDDVFFRHYLHSWGVEHKQITMRSEGERATLEVTFTRFAYAMPFELRLSPTMEAAQQAPWRVSGTVRAIQRTINSFETSLTLFHRLEQEAVEVSSGQLIPLDRCLVVAPVEVKKFGPGPSLTVDVDLLFLDIGNDSGDQVKSARKFVFQADDVVFKNYPAPDTINFKRKHPDLDCSGSIGIVLFPIYDTWDSSSDDEEYGMDYAKHLYE